MSMETQAGRHLRNYAKFSGRANRAEYWYWIVPVVTINVVLGFVDETLNPGLQMGTLSWVAMTVFLASILPVLSVSVRRLHDIDRSGWWLLLWFTLVGGIVVLYWACQPGTQTSNRFPEPRLWSEAEDNNALRREDIAMLIHSQAGRQTHKGQGISSFVIGVGSLVTVIALIAIATLSQIKTGKVTPELNMIVGLGMLSVVFFDLIGLGLGVAGTADRASKKMFPALGLMLNIGILALFATCLIIGLSIKGR